MKLTTESPEIKNFLKAWHENGRAGFKKSYPNLDYDTPQYLKFARDRRKYIALDNGSSGCFLVDKESGIVFSIKAYGKVNRPVGELLELTEKFNQASRIGGLREKFR